MMRHIAKKKEEKKRKTKTKKQKQKKEKEKKEKKRELNGNVAARMNVHLATAALQLMFSESRST